MQIFFKYSIDIIGRLYYNAIAVKKNALHRKKAEPVLEKNMEISLLFDFYGQLLKQQQQQAVALYYNDDLSLSEIALELGITRQGVRDCIKRGESQLFTYEEKLGLMKRFRETEAGLYEIESLAKKLIEKYDEKIAVKIIQTAKSLHE